MCKSLFDNVKLRKDLAACNAAYSLLKTDNALCQKQVQVLTDNYADVLNKLDASERELIERDLIIGLMEDGPGEPDKSKIRVLTQAVLHQRLFEAFGPRYTTCHKVLFSDGDWLVGPKSDMDKYLDYYSMFWLPKVKPYTIIEWTKLDGTVVKIWVRDCDDFADHLQGIPTMHLDWTGLPWGMMWGRVEGVFIAGGHAFNFMLTCGDSFDEVTTEGLDLWLIEPQQGQSWSVPTPEGDITIYDVASFKLQPMGGFTVPDLWFVKV